MSHSKKSNYTSKTDLIGDHLYYDKPTRLWSFIRRPDIIGLGVSTLSLFALARAELIYPLTVPLALVLGLLGGPHFHNTEKELAQNFLGSSETYEKLHINKKPSPDLPPNLDKWGLVVDKLHSKYNLAFSLFSISLGALTIGSLATIPLLLPQGHLDVPAMMLTGDAPLFARLYYGIKRMNKLSSGEWRIESRGPTPEKVLSRVAKKISAATEGFTPSPATQPSGAYSFSRSPKPALFRRKQVQTAASLM